jgi:Wiskott-Aldrich syndrome protein
MVVQDTEKIEATNVKRKKGKICKDDIGVPSDFKHVAHVGWDKEKGFRLENRTSGLKEFFEDAGISTKYLKDESSRRFIYDFIETYQKKPEVQEQQQQQV